MGRRRQRLPAPDQTSKRPRAIESEDVAKPPPKRRLVRKSVIEIEKESRSMDEFLKLNKIGDGSYGVVYRVRDKTTGEILAVKEQARRDAVQEVGILASLQHPSIVGFKHMAKGGDDERVSMVMEYVENDLESLLDAMEQPLSESEVKCLMLQLLQGVDCLHANRVVHRDLKPSNLLFSNRGELKICDFGMASRLNTRHTIRNTGTVVTLGYRAPELLFKAKSYSKAVDMWSVGCIMAEFLLGDLLFVAKTEIDQIEAIFKILGSPNEAVWPGFSKLPGVKGNETVASLVKSNRSRLSLRLPSMSSPVISDAGFDLLSKLLVYNPMKRITAKEALDHPWFREAPLPKSKDCRPTFLPSYAWIRSK